MNNVRPTTLAITGALVCLALGLFFGLLLGGHPESLPSGLRNFFVDDDRALQAEVEDEIKDNFYRPVSDDKLDEAALKGMVRSLRDRFSHYFTPEEARLFAQSLSGSFEGIGTTVDEDPKGLRILQVFPGSPAEKAGLKRGDVMVKVGRDSLAGEPSDIATAKIKGPAGSKVTLTVASGRKTRTVTITRARVKVPVVQARTVTRDGRKLAVVRLLSFSSGAHGELKREIDRQIDGGAQGIVLDLRGNGGGLLEEAVLVSSLFIEDGPIVSTKGRTEPEDKRSATGAAVYPKGPLVVLVDRGTASASEIVSGAIKDRKRGTVVGTRTFGKGVVQRVIPLSNDGVLDITVASYFLPNGESINRRGVTPQVPARDNPRTPRDEALPAALRTLVEQAR